MIRLHRFAAILIISLAWLGLPPVGAAETDEVPAKDPFPPEQIEQLVAPIALYPDALIAQMLMAATYPLDIVQANRWLADHKDLEGDALQQAVDQESWDESVKALVFFPSVLEFMSDNLDWTQDLGDAVLAQQGDVTDAIQRLRAEADAAGALASTDQQKVEKDGDTIIIQPAQPEIVYVPAYDPVTAYGDSAPPATAYYPDAYADASASYNAGYAAGASSTTSYVPSGQVVPVESGGINTDTLVNFGVGALAGGLLTAAIMWNDNDRYDRLYYGGPGYYNGPTYWSQPNYWRGGGGPGGWNQPNAWGGNGWRQPANIQVNRDIQRGDLTVNRGIVGNDITTNRMRKWEHNPERRGGVRYRDASTQNRFSARRGERTIDRDSARGRRINAPDLSRVQRDGALTGGTARLTDRRGKGGAGASVRDRGRTAQPGHRAKGGGAVGGKARPRTKPATRGGGSSRRPVDRQAKRPSLSSAKRSGGAGSGRAQRRAKSGGGSGSRAFQPRRSQASRQASHRGAASRAKSGRGGGVRRGGGGRGGPRR